MNLVRQAGQRVRLGYSIHVREEFIDLVHDTRLSVSAAAKQLGITWPTAQKWRDEYRIAELEINQHLGT